MPVSTAALVCVLAALLASGRASAETLHLRVNGVAMELTRAVGAEAARMLAERSDEFRDSRPSALGAGGWSLRSRIDAARSVALQQRGAGDALEVLHSVVDLSQAPVPPARVPLSLPPDVEVGAVVEALGDSPSAQWSLRSARSLAQVLKEIGERAAQRGWRVEAVDGSALSLERGSERLRLLPAGGRSARSTQLTLIRWSAPR